MIDVITRMVETQNSLNNAFISKDWTKQRLNWLRYVRVEAYELMDHYNSFKHWKPHEPDIEQARIELVDIWHFILSELIRSEYSLEDFVEQFTAGLNYEDPNGVLDVNDVVDTLVSYTFNNHDYMHTAFGHLHQMLDVDLDWVALAYLGKVALNYLRINHGQAEGTYVKHWGPDKIEDNVYLERILEEKPFADIDVIYELLETEYVKHNGEK